MIAPNTKALSCLYLITIRDFREKFVFDNFTMGWDNARKGKRFPNSFHRIGENTMKTTLRIFVLLTLLAGALAACAPKAPPPLEGSYDVAGTNPDGSTYEATIDVAASGEAYTWNWNGGEYKGVGLKEGNIVTVAWGSDACYAVSYTIGDDGVLTGKWTDMSISGIGADVATPADPSQMNGIEGLYNAAGKNPDGSEYGCSLQVTKKADGVYEWFWFNCGEYTGIGIQKGNVVSVSYGASECSAISYEIQEDGNLKATWGYVGQSELGSEELTHK